MKEIIVLIALVLFIWQLSRWIGPPIRRDREAPPAGPNLETDVLPADVPVILDT
ncbi:MAG: hypothetical protein IT318_26495 [Anaerolineales bacterium]|nr:hypothetical protein [Anaerolineales bacterium]